RFPFEPVSPGARYTPAGIEVDGPEPPAAPWSAVPPGHAHPLADPRADVLRGPVEAWVVESEGRARTASGAGLAQALAVLGVRDARVRPLTPVEALALMAWAGASGGAHGRRRGAALGRFSAWFALTAGGGLES